jgi:hypothetical protein
MAKGKIRDKSKEVFWRRTVRRQGQSGLTVRAFCRKHDIVLIMDEVQAGFGRTGRMFGYEHYGIRPDLIACGKGITSSLPLAAVMGRSEVLSTYAPGSMTSTHTGNPVCAAAVLANLRVIQEEGLVENARKMGKILVPEMVRIGRRCPREQGSGHCSRCSNNCGDQGHHGTYRWRRTVRNPHVCPHPTLTPACRERVRPSCQWPAPANMMGRNMAQRTLITATELQTGVTPSVTQAVFTIGSGPTVPGSYASTRNETDWGTPAKSVPLHDTVPAA